jgi:hypothetical protein
MANGPDDQSSAQSARANRLRLAKEDYARAMEDAQKEAIAVRKNMVRLKELRLAKEAEAAGAASTTVVKDPPIKTKPRRRAK